MAMLPTGEGGPTHDCKEVLEEVDATRPDLEETGQFQILTGLCILMTPAW